MAAQSVSPLGNWSYPTTVWFGEGRIAALPAACRTLAIERPLLVTDPGLAGLPMIANALAANDEAGLPTALFAEVRGNPVEENVAAGVAAYRSGGHDGVIAFGGGSALDCGKAVAFMVGQTRPIWDFEDREDWYTRADSEAIAPIVAVPTTAGTGSEVGRAAVITDPASHTKKIIFHPRMLPGIVIADAALTMGLPPAITAATGMDALSHNLEAYCSPAYHPMAAGIALEGMRLVKEWLPVAVEDGGNLVARAHMLAAASMGASAFQKGLGAMHSLSHPCSALLDTHHGLTNAVVMPYVLAYNRAEIQARCSRPLSRSARPDGRRQTWVGLTNAVVMPYVLAYNRAEIGDKLAALARYLDLPDRTAAGVETWVLDLRREIGIPTGMAAITTDHGDVPISVEIRGAGIAG